MLIETIVLDELLLRHKKARNSETVRLLATMSKNNAEAALDMSRRITITLPDQIAADLEAWAFEEGRSHTQLANLLVELSVRQKYPERYPPAITETKRSQGAQPAKDEKS